MWRDLTGAAEDESVHLADWPGGRPDAVDRGLEAGWRWPADCPRWGGRPGPRRASRCASPWPGPWSSCPRVARRSCADIVEDELNVDEVDTADELGDVLDFELVPNFKPSDRGWASGSRSSRRRWRRSTADAAAAALEAGRPITGRSSAASPSSSTPEDVELRVRGPAGLRRVPRGWRGGGPRPDASTTSCADGAWPATWSARSRTCARRAGSRCPTASGCGWPGWTRSASTSTSSPARSWPSRS